MGRKKGDRQRRKPGHHADTERKKKPGFSYPAAPERRMGAAACDAMNWPRLRKRTQEDMRNIGEITSGKQACPEDY